MAEVLLSHGYFIHEDVKEAKIMRPYPPLGILYVSAFLKQQGVDTDVFDSTFQSFEALTEKLLKDKPNYLALYANLVTKINLIKIMAFVKASPDLVDTKIILGGPDVTYNVDNYLVHGADYIVIGEGEQSIYELVDALQHNKNIKAHIITNI